MNNERLVSDKNQKGSQSLPVGPLEFNRYKISESSPPHSNFGSPNDQSVIKFRICRKATLFSLILSILVQIILLLATCEASSSSLSDEQLLQLAKDRAHAAKKWAPLIFLHPKEKYFPTAVHSFLKNVIPREMPSQKVSEPPVIISMSRSLDTQALPEGPAGENTYLFAPLDPDCRNCPLPRFLYGDKPSSEYSPPIYATISSCLPTYKQSFRRSRHLSSLRPPPPPRRRFRLRQRSGKGYHYPRRGIRSSRQSSYVSEERSPESSYRSATHIENIDSYSTLTNMLDHYEQEIGNPERDINLPSPSLLPPEDIESEETEISIENNYSTNQPEVQIFNTTEDNNESDSVESTLINGLENLASEIPESSGSNYTFYNEEKVRVTRNPDVTANQSIKQQYLHQSDKEFAKKGKLRGHKFTVTYWMFYPFSQGKEVCTSRLWFFGRVFKPRLRNKCFGEAITLNSHVGDWEHISIYFEDNTPTLMYVSMHTYGAYYVYNRRKNIFVYRGKDTRLGIPLKPKYPQIVKMDGSHPVLYSALGSHGLWGGPGIHRYENLVPLDDKTAPGTPWKSWKNIDVIDYREKDYSRPDRQWLQFYGRWGNPSSGCHRALFGTCDLASGPTGIPLKRSNFPCHLPYHETFFPKD